MTYTVLLADASLKELGLTHTVATSTDRRLMAAFTNEKDATEWNDKMNKSQADVDERMKNQNEGTPKNQATVQGKVETAESKMSLTEKVEAAKQEQMNKQNPQPPLQK